MQKGFTLIIILVGILVIVTVAGGAYYFGKFQVPKPQPQNPVVISQTPQATIAPSSIPEASREPNGSVASPASIGVGDNPVPNGTRETANWKTYQDFTYKYSIRYPNDWVLIQGKDSDGNSQVTIKSIKTEKAGFSSRQLPELIIGLGGPYSTSGAVCSNQICDETKKETANIDGKAYTFPIMKGAVGLNGDITKQQFDFYAFTFSINHKKISMPGYTEPVSLNVYSSYKTLEEEKTILNILSTFRFD